MSERIIVTEKEGWKKNEKIFRIISATSKRLGRKSYVIGGFVRDLMMGRECSGDIDVVVIGNGVKFARAIARDIRPERASVYTYKNYGTARLGYGRFSVEIVGARKEFYKRENQTAIIEDGTLEEDMLRRDFTINAMAISLNEGDYGELIDNHGGMDDLSKGIIRTVSDPMTTYSDDPLRILRNIRFRCQLGFNGSDIEDSEAMAEVSGKLRNISIERIREEIQKIIMSPDPSLGFTLMAMIGKGNPVVTIMDYAIPELRALYNMGSVGHKNHFEHSLQVLENVSRESNNVWLRWAALLHDIGKVKTERTLPDGTYTYHDHENVGARIVETIFRRLHLNTHTPMEYVVKLVQMHMRLESIDPETVTDSALRRLIHDAGSVEILEDLFTLVSCDITSRSETKINRGKEKVEKIHALCEDLIRREEVRLFKPVIAGNEIKEILGLRKGKLVGDLKQFLIDSIFSGEVENEYEPLKKILLEEFERRKAEGKLPRYKMREYERETDSKGNG